MQEMVNCNAEWVRVVFGGNLHDSVTKSTVHSGTWLRHHSQVTITANFKMSLFISHVTCCGRASREDPSYFLLETVRTPQWKLINRFRLSTRKGFFWCFIENRGDIGKITQKKAMKKKSYEWGFRRNIRVLFLYERTHMSNKN